MLYPIINDSTPDSVLFPKHVGRGLELGNRPSSARAYGGLAGAFPSSLLIPRSEWQARIQEQKERKCRIIDVCDQAGLKVKDQQQTNFCWANGPTHCAEIVRVMQGQAPIVLSAASVACQVNGFRNQGGWGKDALDWIVAHGIVPESLWPNAAISRQYLTAEAKAAMPHYQATEWLELEPRNLDELVSCILNGVACAVGYNWWSHEVTGTFLEWIDGTVALGIDNSWGTGWGTNGRGIIQGNRMLPDDAVACTVLKAA